MNASASQQGFILVASVQLKHDCGPISNSSKIKATRQATNGKFEDDGDSNLASPCTTKIHPCFYPQGFFIKTTTKFPTIAIINEFWYGVFRVHERYLKVSKLFFNLSR